jgi:hypothetical protein
VVMRGGISTNMVRAWTNFQFPGCSLFTKVLDPDVMMNPPRVGETATAPVITDAPPVVIDAQDGPANAAGKCLSCKKKQVVVGIQLLSNMAFTYQLFEKLSKSDDAAQVDNNDSTYNVPGGEDDKEGEEAEDKDEDTEGDKAPVRKKRKVISCTCV